MKMHETVSGKKTRSLITWKIYDFMLQNGKAFLIRTLFKNNTISYYYFIYNRDVCIYASSCTLRKYYKKIKNLGHSSLLKAIFFAKKNSCKNFYLGTKTIFSINPIDPKLKNIENFKSYFSKKKENFLCLNNLPVDFTNINSF